MLCVETSTEYITLSWVSEKSEGWVYLLTNETKLATDRQHLPLLDQKNMESVTDEENVPLCHLFSS